MYAQETMLSLLYVIVFSQRASGNIGRKKPFSDAAISKLNKTGFPPITMPYLSLFTSPL